MMMIKIGRLVLGFAVLMMVMAFIAGSSSSLSEEEKAQKWVDSVFNSLSEEERIGQFFMVAAYSNKDETHYSNIEKLIKDYNIGGLIFFQGGPGREATLTNRYQAAAKVPLFIAMDAEWGLGMRLKDSTVSFPKQMTLGAIQGDSLIREMGAEIGRHCKRLGIHINFAPVVDINNNPNNPVIGVRSFGEDKENVAQKGIAYMEGMQGERVMANAKHFPGHGDTDKDSHKDLPVVNHPKERLQNIEHYPFQKIFDKGCKSVMVAHLQVPAYEKEANTASTLSKTIVTDLLKNEMGFEGLIFTDAINMKGVSKFYEPDEINVRALMAGNDILLYPVDVPAAVERIKKSIKKKELKKSDLHARVKKILLGKYWAGLHQLEPVATNHLYEDLNTPYAYSLREKLYEKSLIVAKDQDQLIPLQNLDTTSIATLTIGLEAGNDYDKMVDNYKEVDHYHISSSADVSEFNALLEKLQKYEVVLASIHNTSWRPKSNYGIKQTAIDFIDELNRRTKVVTSIFACPYALKDFASSSNLICAHRDLPVTQKLVPQLIFGAIGANGRMPVTASEYFPVGMGATVYPINRLRYTNPLSQGFIPDSLEKIDAIAHQAIADSATPGCQIMVVRNGAVVYDKSFGHHTYDAKIPVTQYSIYDVASITKMAATTQGVMFLYENGLINLDDNIGKYLPELKGTNKEDLIIRDILTHQAGLKPYLMHWLKTMEDDTLIENYFCVNDQDEIYCNMVTPGMYALTTLEDSLWKWTVDSELMYKRRKKDAYKYKYSDLGFYMMQRLVEKMTNQPIEDFVNQNFYESMGMSSFGYLPLQRFPFNRIVPTEYDKYWRHVQVHGTVHDQGAAMMGGVGGHAGLFGNANDLAKIMQMNMNGGHYGAKRYFSDSTISMFTKKQCEHNRRGLGFDRKEPKGNGPTSDLVTEKCFGHSGFTGVVAWADPEYDLIYIFLSNRVYPDAMNKKLIRQNVRTNIQDIVYRAMKDYKSN